MAETETKKVQFQLPEANVQNPPVVNGEAATEDVEVKLGGSNDVTAGVIDTSHLLEQNLETLDVKTLTPLTPEVISRQATINIGTIGHVAHGKSTVVKAISGVHTVRYKDELERNITIRLGYANAKIYCVDKESLDEEHTYEDSYLAMMPEYYCAKGSAHADTFEAPEQFGPGAKYKLLRHVSFVDCPGHDILMATMLTGAAIMDAALLLVAANESCPQPQTYEHLAAIEIMKLKHIIVLQNKIDLVTKDDAKKQQGDIREFIKGTIAEEAPIIPISAQLKFNVDVLCQYMVNNVPVPLRDFSSDPRLIVIRSFDVNKPGCEVKNLQGGIAGGSILHGVFRVGQEVEIRPGISWKDGHTGHFHSRPLYSNIVSLSSEQNSLQYAAPGGLIGMGLRVDPMICRGDSLVGNLVGLPGSLPDVYDLVEVSFHLMRRLVGARTDEGKKHARIENLSKGENLQVNIGSFCTTAIVKQIKQDQTRLELYRPICAEEGEKVAISRRIDRHWRLIGWGKIVRGHKVLIEN